MAANLVFGEMGLLAAAYILELAIQFILHKPDLTLETMATGSKLNKITNVETNVDQQEGNNCYQSEILI